MGQRGHLRGKRHLCQPKRNKNLVGEESHVHGLKDEREHEVTSCKRSLEWLEFGICKGPDEEEQESGRSWSLSGHVEFRFNSLKLPELI